VAEHVETGFQAVVQAPKPRARIMRYELTDYEWVRHQANAAEQAAPRTTGERPSRPQWHLLGVAIRRTLARSAAELRPLHHLLQPFRSLAAGWRLEDPADVSWGKLDACGRGYISVNFRSSPNRTWL
jgi:hypothetical protein